MTAERLKTLSKYAFTDVLKPRGFRKSGGRYHRRHGECVQLVQLQASHGSDAANKRFYVNVGLCFDAIGALVDAEPLERPKEHECDARGLRDRLEAWFQSAPPHWQSTQDETMDRKLHGLITALADALDGIDGPESFRAHPWFERRRPAGVCAQTLAIIGDDDAARAEVQALARSFEGRRMLEDPAHWFRTLGLDRLAR